MSPHIETPRCNKRQPGGQPAFDPVTLGKRLSSRGAITESIRYAGRSADVARTCAIHAKLFQTQDLS